MVETKIKHSNREMISSHIEIKPHINITLVFMTDNKLMTGTVPLHRKSKGVPTLNK